MLAGSGIWFGFGTVPYLVRGGTILGRRCTMTASKLGSGSNLVQALKGDKDCMSDAEIQAEIVKQIRDKLARLATKLRDTAQEHGPVIGKTLKLVAEEIEQLA